LTDWVIDVLHLLAIDCDVLWCCLGDQPVPWIWRDD